MFESDIKMNDDVKTLIYAVICVIICLIVISLFVIFINDSNKYENMAPSEFGAFQNNYLQGKCNPGSFERTFCSLGNCPLESIISNKGYCMIQCAQDPDKKIRQQCYNECIDMMERGCK